VVRRRRPADKDLDQKIKINRIIRNGPVAPRLRPGDRQVELYFVESFTFAAYTEASVVIGRSSPAKRRGLPHPLARLPKMARTRAAVGLRPSNLDFLAGFP
jgi:hypothetical protein